MHFKVYDDVNPMKLLKDAGTRPNSMDGFNDFQDPRLQAWKLPLVRFDV